MWWTLVCLAVRLALAADSKSTFYSKYTYSLTTSIEPFVKVLKDNLRINNDDYIENAENTRKSETSADATVTIKTIQPVEFNNQWVKSLRRLNNNDTFVTKRENILQKRSNDVDDHITSDKMENVNDRKRKEVQSLNYTKNDKYVERRRFQTAQQSSVDAAVAGAQHWPRALGRAVYPIGVKSEEGKETARLMKRFKIQRKKIYGDRKNIKPTKKPIERMRMDNEVIRVEQWNLKNLPREDQLDMGPARHGKIDAFRIKGRVCERNVMLPEGPKYDSKGWMYLAQYNKSKDFANTRRPKIILPRCCNCCKKSVLGCE